MGLIFWRKKPMLDKPFPEKVQRRVNTLPTADLVLWIEQAMSETNRSLSAYQKHGDKVYLADMEMGAEAMHALVHELHKRSVL
jgi:hypothetical protein